MRVISKEEFFKIILDGKTVGELMVTPSVDLHYLQLIFFRPFFAKLSVALFFGLSLLVFFLLNSWLLRIIFGAIMLYTDYKNRHFLKVFTTNTCLYEVFNK